MQLDKIVVVDVETTGVQPKCHDRMIEIGIVVMDSRGRTIEEYETLINPKRDIGPTQIHRITAGEVLHAPTFDQVAGDILGFLQQSELVCGHNANFDWRFLTTEFERLGQRIPDVPLYCTLRQIGRGSLEACCYELGVDFEGTQHHALSDARATAKLVKRLLDDDPSSIEGYLVPSVTWPELPRNGNILTRSLAADLQAGPPAYLLKLASSIRHSGDEENSNSIAYLALIDRILEDRVIDSDEEQVLVGAAQEWGLTFEQIARLHTQYLESLVVRALADGVVTEAENRDLQLVARLLGQDVSKLEDMIEHTSKQLGSVAEQRANASRNLSNDLTGKSVCFTGQLLCSLAGSPITRELAEELASQAGLVPKGSVTKKLDMLVLADPNTQSGKAKKAREYGTRILADSVFWDLIGLRVD